MISFTTVIDLIVTAIVKLFTNDPVIIQNAVNIATIALVLLFDMLLLYALIVFVNFLRKVPKRLEGIEYEMEQLNKNLGEARLDIKLLKSQARVENTPKPEPNPEEKKPFVGGAIVSDNGTPAKEETDESNLPGY